MAENSKLPLTSVSSPGKVDVKSICPFLQELPVEVRDTIYEFTFVKQHVRMAIKTSTSSSTKLTSLGIMNNSENNVPFSVLRTCRQIRTEALPVFHRTFYQNTLFELTQPAVVDLMVGEFGKNNTRLIKSLCIDVPHGLRIIDSMCQTLANNFTSLKVLVLQFGPQEENDHWREANSNTGSLPAEYFRSVMYFQSKANELPRTLMQDSVECGYSIFLRAHNSFKCGKVCLFFSTSAVGETKLTDASTT